MKIIEVSTASKSLSAYADEFRAEITVFTWHGQAIATVTPLQDKEDLESLSLGDSPEFIDIIKKARDEFEAGKKLSLGEMKREIF